MKLFFVYRDARAAPQYRQRLRIRFVRSLSRVYSRLQVFWTVFGALPQ